MNVALPGSMKKYILRRVTEGGYGSASEYVRALVRSDAARQAYADLEVKVADGLASGPATPMTDEDWVTLRSEVRERRRR